MTLPPSQGMDWLKTLLNEHAQEQKILQAPLMLADVWDNVHLFFGLQPFFYDRAGLFWFWQPSTFRWTPVDETDVMTSLDTNLHLTGLTLRSGLKMMYLEAFKRYGRLHIPPDPPPTWLQFKDQIYDLTTGQVHPATPNYFICNPLPWTLGPTEETPTMDRLFTEWVGEQYVPTLYELLAYCCLPDYPLHRIVAIVGTGANGKSQFQKVLSTFLGIYNICSTELDQLSEHARFETLRFHKKLACIMGETEFATIKKTGMIKRLSGQDLIPMEVKGGKHFEAYSYAKLWVNTNQLPSSTDKSDGWFRRWIILEFPHQFEDGHEIYLTIPPAEYEALARKVLHLLPALLARGKFTNEGTIQERREAYELASNPLPYFLAEYCELNPFEEPYTFFGQFYTAYSQFLNYLKKRSISTKELSKNLAQEGIELKNTTKTRHSGTFDSFGSGKMEYIKGFFVENVKIEGAKLQRLLHGEKSAPLL